MKSYGFTTLLLKLPGPIATWIDSRSTRTMERHTIVRTNKQQSGRGLESIQLKEKFDQSINNSMILPFLATKVFSAATHLALPSIIFRTSTRKYFRLQLPTCRLHCVNSIFQVRTLHSTFQEEITPFHSFWNQIISLGQLLVLTSFKQFGQKTIICDQHLLQK